MLRETECSILSTLYKRKIKDTILYVYSIDLALIVYTIYHLCQQNHQEYLVHLSAQPGVKLQAAAFHTNDLNLKDSAFNDINVVNSFSTGME